LVCRGCKRFAHEIVQWNGYAEDQQAHVWRRLSTLRDEVVGQYLQILSPSDFHAVSSVAGLDELATPEQAYAVLSFLVAKDWPLDKAGLSVVDDTIDEPSTPLALMQSIDAEIYARSLAHYERNFKVLA
jgi:hypothetical protein